MNLHYAKFPKLYEVVVTLLRQIFVSFSGIGVQLIH